MGFGDTFIKLQQRQREGREGGGRDRGGGGGQRGREGEVRCREDVHA